MGIIVCCGYHRCIDGHERQHHSRSLVIVVGSEGHHPCCQKASITIAGLRRYCSHVPLTIHGCRDRPVVVESSRSRRRCQLWSLASTVVVVAVSRGRWGGRSWSTLWSAVVLILVVIIINTVVPVSQVINILGVVRMKRRPDNKTIYHH